jgi:hypothetical protein
MSTSRTSTAPGAGPTPAAGIDVGLLTPPQRRVYEELLAVGAPRPPADDGLGEHVRRTVTEQTAAAALLRPAGARVVRLNKTALSALVCDGRYLDHRASRFAWSPQTALGTLTHRGVQLDGAGRRAHDVHAVVAQAWQDFCGSSESAAAFGTNLNAVEQDAIRAEAADRVLEFRDCFPLLPPRWAVRYETALRCTLHRGALELVGRPDMVLGGPHPTRRRMLLIDLKTGRRNPGDRADMRFYALLATLKYGTAPFRVATYYLDEADWAAEDVDEHRLTSAAGTLAQQALQAARLEWTPGGGSLRLAPGPACSWCTRAPDCPAGDQAPRQLQPRAA